MCSAIMRSIYKGFNDSLKIRYHMHLGIESIFPLSRDQFLKLLLDVDMVFSKSFIKHRLEVSHPDGIFFGSTSKTWRGNVSMFVCKKLTSWLRLPGSISELLEKCEIDDGISLCSTGVEFFIVRLKGCSNGSNDFNVYTKAAIYIANVVWSRAYAISIQCLKNIISK